MLKYVEPCVNMWHDRFAKDKFIQYHIGCQQVNVFSLEEATNYFLYLSIKKSNQTQDKAQFFEFFLNDKDLEVEKVLRFSIIKEPS